MRLLKIGSANSCDIVLHSGFVSAVHAEMTLLDNGEILLEDKNSTNGTFIGTQRLTPNQETKVRRGDMIVFGDTTLQWQYVPKMEVVGANETRYNIGSAARCDIVVSDPFVSRYHAELRIVGKKAFLIDYGSKNGTMLNGSKIPKNKPIPVHRKDSVICGTEDVSEQIRHLIPGTASWVMPTLIAVASAAAAVGVFFLLTGGFSGSKVPGYHGNPSEFRQASVYVDAAYHYEIVFEDSPVRKDIWDGTLVYPVRVPYSASAFFIDRNGVLATNRHVTNPGDDAEKEIVRNVGIQILHSQLPEKVENSRQISLLKLSELGEYLFEHCVKTGDISKENVNAMISTLRNSKISVRSQLDYITVGYPGRYYTHMDEYERCYVLGESGTDDKDIALLQLNTKRTPADIKLVFDINACYDGRLEPLKDKLTWIGYPRGNGWGLDDKTHSLEPEIRETMVSKQPSRFSFEFQGEAVGGASGSPIFNTKTGRLVGVLFGGWVGGATYGHACQARYLKELYDEFRDVIQP